VTTPEEDMTNEGGPESDRARWVKKYWPFTEDEELLNEMWDGAHFGGCDEKCDEADDES